MELATFGSDAWWTGVLAGRDSDPRPLATYCSALGISVSQYYYRRGKAERRSLSTSEFREYALPATAAMASGVSLRLGGIQIELAPGFDAATLRAVLACCR